MSREKRVRWKLLRRAMLAQTATLAKFLPAARDGATAVPLHALRVASRRLRNTLGIFRDLLPRKLRRRWKQALRRAANAFGVARDLDVQIAFLRDHLASLKGRTHAVDRPGVERLLLRLRQRREEAQRRVLKGVKRLRRAKVASEMDRFARRRQPHGKSSESPRRMARRAIAARLASVLAHDAEVPSGAEQPLHEMRIAAKHLRYTLSAQTRLFRNHLREPLKMARSWQQQLGAIHDCDVWLQQLPLFLRDERQRHQQFLGNDKGLEKIAPGVERLLENRRQFRRQLHADFVTQWQREKHHEAWTRFGGPTAPNSPAPQSTSSSSNGKHATQRNGGIAIRPRKGTAVQE